LDIERTVSQGADNADALSAAIGFHIASATEFEDTNDNGRLDDGDVALQTRDLSDVAWTAETTVSTDGAFYTVVLTDENGEFVLTFVVAAAEYDVGSLTVPSNSARFFVEITWPFDSRTGKLQLDVKLVVPEGTTTSDDQATSGSRTIEFTRDSVTIGSLAAELTARVASTDLDVLLGDLTDTSSTDTSYKRDATDSVFSVSATFDAFAPGVITWDPVVGGGNQGFTTHAAGSSSGSVVVTSTGSTTSTTTGTTSTTTGTTSTTTGATTTTGAAASSGAAGSSADASTSSGSSTTGGSTSAAGSVSGAVASARPAAALLLLASAVVLVAL